MIAFVVLIVLYASTLFLLYYRKRSHTRTKKKRTVVFKTPIELTLGLTISTVFFYIPRVILNYKSLIQSDMDVRMVLICDTAFYYNIRVAHLVAVRYVIHRNWQKDVDGKKKKVDAAVSMKPIETGSPTEQIEPGSSAFPKTDVAADTMKIQSKGE